jgi:peroxiredoxin
MKKTFLILTALLFLASPQAARAEAEIGQAAPAFTLTGIDGAAHSLSDYAGKTVVLEWTNFECPFVKKHYGSGNMQKLQAEYTAKGVVWLSINSSAPGNQGNFEPAEWTKRAAAWNVKSTAILLDPDGTVGRAYGAKTTPHVFIVNGSGALIYRGAIDDTPGTDPVQIAGAKNYVRAALDAALTGEPVAEPSTKSYGCSVKY